MTKMVNLIFCDFCPNYKKKMEMNQQTTTAKKSIV